MNELSGINFPLMIGIGVGILIVAVIFLVLFTMFRKDKDLASIDRALKAGNYPKALRIGQEYLKLHPADYLIKFYIGQALEGLKSYPEAAAYYEKALVASNLTESNAMKTRISLKVAELYRKIKKNKEALGYYIMVLDREPSNTRALLPAAEMLFEAGNVRKAKQYLETYVSFKPKVLQARYLLSKVCLRAGQSQDAVNQLKYIIANSSGTDAGIKSSSMMVLADIYIANKLFNEAVSLLKPLLDEKGFFDEAIIKLTDTYSRSGQLAKAIDMASRNLSRLPKEKTVQLLYLIASSHFKMGDLVRAIEYWKQAYKADPNYSDIREIMSRYEQIISNPRVLEYFSNDDMKFANLTMGAIKKHSVKQTVKKDSFWAYETGEINHIFYRMAYPIPFADLQEIEKVISQNFRPNMSYNIYALYGMDEDSPDSLLKKNYKVQLIKDADFVKKINEA